MTKQLTTTLQKIKKKHRTETLGEALEIFLNTCDQIPYCDWRIQPLAETIEAYNEYEEQD